MGTPEVETPNLGVSTLHAEVLIENNEYQLQHTIIIYSCKEVSANYKFFVISSEILYLCIRKLVVKEEDMTDHLYKILF